MTAIQVLVGAVFAALLADFVRRHAWIRTVLIENAVSMAGTAAVAAGLALLLVVPIWKSMSDAGTLWCGTYLNRSESWPSACDYTWDLYDQRLDLARWPLLLGAVLVGAGNTLRLVRQGRRSSTAR